jgi:transforming growth factor-beta-induced protein
MRMSLRLLGGTMTAASIFALLVLSALPRQTMAADKGGYGDKAAKADIVDTAVAAGQFKTLAAALQAAGLVETLKSDGPFTVFAPTDEAFAKLPAGTVEDLLKPENKDKLIAVLTYHVVPGKVMAKDVVTLSSAKTVNGKALSIKSADGKVMINTATVAKADITASNGVIHVIDTVLLP